MNEKFTEPSITAVSKSAPPELERLEAIVERSRSKPKEEALALLAIHDQRLYVSEYVSFNNYLWKRWQIGRSRGYQLLHWARLLTKATEAGLDGPVNERQGRPVDANGKVQDSTMRAMAYLIKTWNAIAPAERNEFIQSLRSLLTEMEQEIGSAVNTEQSAALETQ